MLRSTQKTYDDFIWKDQRFEYLNEDLIYHGYNQTHDVATSATTWYIIKYTYVNNNVTRKQGPLIGSWDGRAALAW
jgi:hypothetical protein